MSGAGERRATIQAKLVGAALSVFLPALAAVLFSAAAINVILGARTRDATAARIEGALSAKGRLLTANNAQALEGMAEGNAFLQIRDLVASTVAGDSDLEFGLFIPSDTASPCVVADKSDPAATRGIFRRVARVADRRLVEWGRSAKALTGERSAGAMDFAAPVGNPQAPLGWIVYRLSTRSTTEEIEGASRRVARTFAVLLSILGAVGGLAVAYARHKFRGEASRLSAPIGELAAAASAIEDGNFAKPIPTGYDDEIGELAHAFETMRAKIQVYTERLEELVETKTREVREILDNVDQGILVANLDGTLSPERSRATAEILGTRDFGSLRGALGLSPSQEEDFLAWLRLVRDRHCCIRWDKITRLAPVQELEVPGPDGAIRNVRLRYQRMLDRDRRVERVMILAQDETEARRTERIVAQERDRHDNEVRTILGLVNHPPEMVREFLSDVRRRMDALEDLARSMLGRSIAARERHPEGPGFHPHAEEVGRLFRDLHTIKGNAATFGFENLARLAHANEDVVEDLKAPVSIRTADTLRRLLDGLARMDEAHRDVLSMERRLSGGGSDGESLVQVPERKLENLRRMGESLLLQIQGREEWEAAASLATACSRIRDLPLHKLAEKHRGMVLRLSERLGKRIRFEVHPRRLEIAPGFLARLDEALVHLLRNCVDHGIETPAARAAAGKPETGSVELDVSFHGDEVLAVVSDDGAGIDVESLVRKAVDSGAIPASRAGTMSEEDKLMLVFESGVSTADMLTDLSGRGVGMSAVRESIESLGGSVAIESSKGEGTRVLLRIPAIGLR